MPVTPEQYPIGGELRPSIFGRDPFSPISEERLLEKWLEEQYPSLWPEEAPTIKYGTPEEFRKILPELPEGFLAFYSKAKDLLGLSDLLKQHTWESKKKMMEHEGAAHPYQEYLMSETPRLWDLITMKQPIGGLYMDLAPTYGIPDWGSVEGAMPALRRLAREQWAWKMGGPDIEGGDIDKPWTEKEYGVEPSRLHWLWKEAIPLFMAAAREPKGMNE